MKALYQEKQAGHLYSDSSHMKYPKLSNPKRQKVAWWLPRARGRKELLVDGYRVSVLHYGKRCGDTL